MDRLKAYQLLSRVKPAFFQTRTPYQIAHARRITYNQRELELHYREDLGVYVRMSTRDHKPERVPEKRGGCEISKITFVSI